MSGHHHHGQNVHADQRRAAEQHRQAFQRARMFARQGRQQFYEAGGWLTRRGRSPEGHPPAKVLADNAPDRNTKHHRQRGTGGDQAQRLRPFAGGAMRMASADVIDQNTACAKAIPMRLITSTSKFRAKTTGRGWR